MASGSGINNICSKLRKFTLKDITDSVVSGPQDKKNSNAVKLSPTDNSKLQELNDCSEFTFDNVIGHLEDMLMDENFLKLQNSFLEKYWKEFEDSEENKHSYMIIFNEYTNQTEDFIVEYLKSRINDFDMKSFVAELVERKGSLDGEIFELLLTLCDFTAFKEILLDYRAMKEGRTIDLDDSLSCRQYVID